MLMNILVLFKVTWQLMSNFSTNISHVHRYSSLSSEPDSPSAFKQLSRICYWEWRTNADVVRRWWDSCLSHVMWLTNRWSMIISAGVRLTRYENVFSTTNVASPYELQNLKGCERLFSTEIVMLMGCLPNFP